MRVIIETERLIIRNLRPGIYPQYNSEADGIEWLKDRQLKADDPNDYDLGFVLKETGELIGCGGLVYHPDIDVWRIGYNLRKDAWGNGYVMEALTAIMDEIRKTRKIRAIEGKILSTRNSMGVLISLQRNIGVYLNEFFEN